MQERKIIDFIQNQIGYAPSEIIFDEAFHRFDTDKVNDKNGSYIAHKWTFKGKEYAGVNFTDWSNGRGWLEYKSWNENNFEEKEKKDFEAQQKIQKEKIQKQLEKEQEEKIDSASRLWENAQPISDIEKELAYFMQKGIKKEELEKLKKYFRTHVKQIEHEGEQLESRQLLIPIHKADDKRSFIGVQRIFKTGEKWEKRFTGLISKGFYLIGKLEDNENYPLSLAFLTEGVATALSVHIATNLPVFIAFSASNLPKIAYKVKEIAEKKLNRLFPIVIAGDDDKYDKDGNLRLYKDNAGRVYAEKACLGNLAIAAVFPKFRTEVQKEKRLSDFNDLHFEHGIQELKEQLNVDTLFTLISNRITEIHSSYWHFFIERDIDGKGVSIITEKHKLTNFLLKDKIDIKTVDGETIRLVNIIGEKENVFNVKYSSEDFASLSTLDKWAHRNGKFWLENKNELKMPALKAHLERKQRIIILERNIIGRQSGGGFLFDNCFIQGGQIHEIDQKTKYLLTGSDKKGNILGFKIADSITHSPSLNLTLSPKDTSILVSELVDYLLSVYGYAGLFTLCTAFAGLFREEIAEGTGTKQYPILWAFGERGTGKSNLVLLINLLFGFAERDGITGNSTRASIEAVMTQRSSLVVSINDVKDGKDREKIEGMLLNAFDGQTRSKQRRDGEGWVTSERDLNGFLFVDSNHLPKEEPVLQRIIPVRFRAEIFNKKEASAFNEKRKNLSAITREILMAPDLDAFGFSKAIYESQVKKEIPPRLALGMVYGFLGFQLLVKISDKTEQEIEDLSSAYSNWINNVYMKDALDVQESKEPSIEFLEYAFVSLPYRIKAEDERADKLSSRIKVFKHKNGEDYSHWVCLNYMREAMDGWNKQNPEQRFNNKNLLYETLGRLDFIELRSPDKSIGINKNLNGKTVRGLIFLPNTPENLKNALDELEKVSGSG